MFAAKLLAGLVLAGLALAYGAALFAAEGRLEAARRPGAPPIPPWTRGRYLHLSDPANLAPESGPPQPQRSHHQRTTQPGPQSLPKAPRSSLRTSQPVSAPRPQAEQLPRKQQQQPRAAPRPLPTIYAVPSRDQMIPQYTKMIQRNKISTAHTIASSGSKLGSTPNSKLLAPAAADVEGTSPMTPSGMPRSAARMAGTMRCTPR